MEIIIWQENSDLMADNSFKSRSDNRLDLRKQNEYQADANAARRYV